LRSAAKLLSPAASPPAVIRRAWFFCANAKAQGAVAAALSPSFSIKPLAISGGFYYRHELPVFIDVPGSPDQVERCDWDARSRMNIPAK
jgi:hypothetical protein